MNANPVCPKTGVPMHRGVRPMTLTYKAESITFEMPGWYCDECEESVHTGKDMQVSDRRLNRLKALGEGLLTPENIRRIRQKLRLSQEAAGMLIGGGPRAFQKYESGDLLPSRAISSALVLLDHDPPDRSFYPAPQSAGLSIAPFGPAFSPAYYSGCPSGPEGAERRKQDSAGPLWGSSHSDLSPRSGSVHPGADFSWRVSL